MSGTDIAYGGSRREDGPAVPGAAAFFTPCNTASVTVLTWLCAAGLRRHHDAMRGTETASRAGTETASRA
eukprot:3940825-Rhodomonas_salina.1